MKLCSRLRLYTLPLKHGCLTTLLLLLVCCRYNWSQQYGSIGWSVGATLGLALGGKDAGKRVLACIGDGSFQLTAQVSSIGCGWQLFQSLPWFMRFGSKKM